MKKLDHSFGAYRYFIVPSEQISFFDTVDEKRKCAANLFFSALLADKKRSWEIKGKKHLLIFNRQLSNEIFVCKFSMETKKTIFKEGETDIENIDEIDYPFIYVIIDTQHQIVLIELKTSVFSSLNTAKEKLKKCFEQGFELHGFEVMFEEIADSSTFWTFVDNATGIYEVAFTLNSPNLFGGYNDTNHMLRDISETYNNNETTLKINSKKARLVNIKKENRQLKDAVEYASGGGGEWTLTVATKDAKKKTFKSKHNIKKVAVSRIDTDQDHHKIEEEILNALKSVETILLAKEAKNEEKN